MYGELEATNKELEEVKKTAKKDLNLGETVLYVLGLSAEAAKRNELELRKNFTTSEITRLKTTAPAMTPKSREIRTSTVVSGLGAYVGTIVGFGSGHAIQGRFLRKGWIFALSEVGAIAAIFALSPACQKNNGICSNFTVGVPVFALLGLKIWESVDLFRNSYLHWQGYPHIEPDLGS